MHFAGALDAISFVDYPELNIDEHESTEMPFRYVKDNLGKPVMPAVSTHNIFTDSEFRINRILMITLTMQGMLDIIKQDADKGIKDLF